MATTTHTLAAPLPEAMQFEQLCLGAAIARADLCLAELLDLLRREDFHSEAHRLIYDGLAALNKREAAVDLFTVEDELRNGETLDRIGGAAYLVTLTECGLPVNFAYHAEKVQEATTRRNLIAAAQQVEAAARDHSLSLAEACERAEQAVYRARRTQGISEFTPVAELAMEATERACNPQTTARGVTTGFGKLDRLLFGWKAGELTLICGRPSMGKTQLMLSMAAAAAKSGSRSAIFSLEMPKEDLVDRLICSIGGIDATRHALGELSEAEQARFISVAGKVGQLPLFISDGLIDRPLGEIRAAARHYLRRLDLDMFWLDHIHRMPTTGENANQAYTEIAKGLKSAARETGKPWNVLAQLSRNVERRDNKRPMLSDLRESGTLEQEADKVIGLYRDGYYRRQEGEDETWPGETEVLVLKHRNGPVGVRKLWFNGPTGHFTDEAWHHEAPPERRSYADD